MLKKPAVFFFNVTTIGEQCTQWFYTTLKRLKYQTIQFIHRRSPAPLFVQSHVIMFFYPTFDPVIIMHNEHRALKAAGQETAPWRNFTNGLLRAYSSSRYVYG